MRSKESAYNIAEDKSEYGLKFFFISKGQRDVIKAIQYAFVQKLNGRDIYNLGFGDYDIEKDIITDDVNTNNGDVYKVFQTVLNTIPVFFGHFEQAI